MSRDGRKKAQETNPEPSEGWETLAEEESVGSLKENPELEAALREAAESVESIHQEAVAQRGGERGGEGEGEPRDAAGGEFADDEVGRLESELAGTREQMLRLQADFENFRRRALKERQETLQYGYQNLVKDLLSSVDNLDRAIDHARLSGGRDLENLLQGVELVRRDLLGTLANYGVTEIEALGKPFDPALHEAMSQVEEPSVAPNTVLEVLEKGYQLRDRLVRPSRVVVAKAPDRGAGEQGNGGEA